MGKLWQYSANNGVDITYGSWQPQAVGQKNNIGSLICLTFGDNISLAQDDYPGKQGQYTLQVRVSGKNLCSTALSLSLQTTVIYPARCFITKNTSYSIRGLEEEEYKQLVNVPISDHSTVEAQGMDGKGIFGKKFKRRVQRTTHVANDRIMDAVNSAKNAVEAVREHVAGGTYVGGGLQSRF